MYSLQKIISVLLHLSVASALLLFAHGRSETEEKFTLQKDIKCNKTCSICEKELIYCARFDHCGCCQSCLRQYGEFCDSINLCDYKKKLICQMEESIDHGICRFNSQFIKDTFVDNAEKVCIFNGVTYQSTVQFSVSCRHRCQCNDGLVTCQDLCKDVEQSSPPPVSICPYGAELIPPVDNQCCREWSCKMDYLGNFADNIVNNMKKKTTFQKFCVNKLQMETPWSKCSRTCGMGISTRTSTNNFLCVNITQKRFCMYKECPKMIESPSKKSKPQLCSPTTRPVNASKIRIVLDFENRLSMDKIICYSKRKFRPRFCGDCSQCCHPVKSKTKRIEFQCSDNINRIQMYQWIKACRCEPKVCRRSIGF